MLKWGAGNRIGRFSAHFRWFSTKGQAVAYASKLYGGFVVHRVTEPKDHGWTRRALKTGKPGRRSV